MELRLGPALETLPQLAAEDRGPFDFIFLDADKQNNPHYLAWALKLSRPGSLIIADKWCATAIQTVGGKGYDGFVIALVTA